MLHFFRKIRHDLIANSQTFKYLKYAIGEVILVVLGILIALQINNWNEQKKLDLKKQVYIDRLKYDLVRDTINLHYYIAECNKKVKLWRITAKQIQNSTTTIDTIKSVLSNSSFWPHQYKQQYKATYSSLMSNGDIDLFYEDHMVMLIDFYAIRKNNQNTIIGTQGYLNSNSSELIKNLGFSIIKDETTTYYQKVTFEIDAAKKTGILSDYLYSNSNYLFNNWQLAHYGMIRSKAVLKALNNPNENSSSDISHIFK